MPGRCLEYSGAAVCESNCGSETREVRERVQALEQKVDGCGGVHITQTYVCARSKKKYIGMLALVTGVARQRVRTVRGWACRRVASMDLLS
jgi:hypothetical protein